jgi:hypothetical protein
MFELLWVLERLDTLSILPRYKRLPILALLPQPITEVLTHERAESSTSQVVTQAMNMVNIAAMEDVEIVQQDLCI